MRHLDLFSGIGGFALAASWVWGEEHEIVTFCEIDKFCQKVLRRHWPDVPIIEDVREVTLEKIMAHAFINRRGFDGLESGIREEDKAFNREPDGINNVRIDLLTGGFPCQPFSCAGKRQGASDARFLWPEMLRVIQETAPTWIIAENVPGLLSLNGGLEFESVYASLENEGYEVQPFIIPACAVNAPHRRDRVWIVAHNESGKSGEPEAGNGREGVGGRSEDVANNESLGLCGAARDRELVGNVRPTFGDSENRVKQYGNWEFEPDVGRVVDGLSSQLDGTIRRLADGTCDTQETITEVISHRRGILLSLWQCRQRATASYRTESEVLYSCMSEMPYRDSYEGWILGQRIAEDKELLNLWKRVHASPFDETQDLQQEMLVRIGEKERTQKMAKDRVNRLRSLGNAIVPQVAEQIMRVIKSAL